MKLQFSFKKNIPAVIDDNGVETSPQKILYEYLGTSNTKLPDCDLKLSGDIFTEDDLALLSDGAELVYKNSEYSVRDWSGNTNKIVVKKAQRLYKIEAEIRSLWAMETTSTFLTTANTTRIAELRAEKLKIESSLDKTTKGMEQSVIDDIILSIFS